jgi:hypothetical protein
MRRHESNLPFGGPAFPFVFDDGRQRNVYTGMTLRDYFAAKAMPMALAEYRMLTERGENEPMEEDWGILFGLSSVASKAYQLADAMLEARES